MILLPRTSSGSDEEAAAPLADGRLCPKRGLFACLLLVHTLHTLNACSTRFESFLLGSIS